MKTNILSKIHDDHFKNVASRASTRFSFVWPDDLVSDIKCSSFKLDLESIKTNILSIIFMMII